MRRSCLCADVLLANLGGLSLTSLSVILTVVVPARPPSCPPISLAWITTWYDSLISRSMLGNAILITPEHTRKDGGGDEREQVESVSQVAVHLNPISWDVLAEMVRYGF